MLRNQIQRDADLSFETLEEDAASDQLDVDVYDSESPVVRFVNFMLADGKASDIHIESEEDCVRIRFRIDGDLHDMQRLPSAIRPAVRSRLKIVAGLNIIETRQPQGRARRRRCGW